MSAENNLSQPQPPPDSCMAYGADPSQFLAVRLSRTKGPHSVLLNIHGGYWRAWYDLTHPGHLYEALRSAVVRAKLVFGANGVRRVVRPERIELPTSWFVAMHSIQLSYGRIAAELRP